MESESNSWSSARMGSSSPEVRENACNAGCSSGRVVIVALVTNSAVAAYSSVSSARALERASVPGGTCLLWALNNRSVVIERSDAWDRAYDSQSKCDTAATHRDGRTSGDNSLTHCLITSSSVASGTAIRQSCAYDSGTSCVCCPWTPDTTIAGSTNFAQAISEEIEACARDPTSCCAACEVPAFAMDVQEQ